MSSLELFDTHYTSEDSIKNLSNTLNEPEWLLERRILAFNEYKHLPFDKDTLFYKYTSFRNFDPKNLLPSWELKPIEDVDTSLIDQVEYSGLIIENNGKIEANLNAELTKQGVFVGTLQELLSIDADKAKAIVEKSSSFSDNFDKLGSLARALAVDTLVIYIPKNLQIKEPLVRITSINNEKSANFAEYIYHFEDGSEATLINIMQKSEGNSNDKMFLSMESVYAGPNSWIKFFQLQDWDQSTLHVSSRISNIDNYARFRSLTHMQGSVMSRHNSYVDLRGQGSEGYDLFVLFGSSKQRFDVKSELHHDGRDTIGQTHARQVMLDKAESILRGLIVIPEQGVNADSWLTSQGMTLNKGKVTAIPALKIDQNEVKAAHAASVEPLNEDLIFYLQTRGIDMERSREMLVIGYFEYVLKLLQNNDAVDISRLFLNKKWMKTQE